MIPGNETPYLVEHGTAITQYRERRAVIPGVTYRAQIGLHTGENDPALAADPAEALASYLSTRKTYGSYHAVGDHKTSILTVSYIDAAFHVATHQLNETTFGYAFACRTTDWLDFSTATTSAYLDRGAERCADISLWCRDRTGIIVDPIIRPIEEILDGAPGFFRHSDADPARRHDPGEHFPADEFLDRYRYYANLGPSPSPADPYEAGKRRVQKILAELGLYHGRIDGYYGPKTLLAAETLHAETIYHRRAHNYMTGTALPELNRLFQDRR